MSMKTGQTIRALPADVAAKIKSSTSITDLHGVVLELAKNSLDAGAQIISISVDFKRGGCIVEDDGLGILPEEFEPHGGLGKPHHTSKFGITDMYGHRGLYLSSLASLSLLTVTSRHKKHASTNSIVFHHARPVARLTPALKGQHLQLRDHGTRVTVNNLFGNMPVRVRNRALVFEKAEAVEKEWETMKHILVSLMLANGQISKLTLSDMTRQKSVTLHANGPIDTVDLARVGTILAQSGYMEPRHMDSWQAVSARTTDLKIQAAISTLPSLSKRVQFISLGNDPISSSHPSNILYSEINRLMASSGYGDPARLSDLEISTCTMPGGRRSESLGGMRSRSGLKPIRKWPMFFIRIDTERLGSVQDGDDLSFALTKSFQDIQDVLQSMVLEFLKQQDLKPSEARKRSKVVHRTRSRSGTARTHAKRPESSVMCHRSPSGKEDFAHGLKLPLFERSQSANTDLQYSNWSRIKAAKAPEKAALERKTVNPPVFDTDERPSYSSRGSSLLPLQKCESSQSPHFGAHSGNVESTHKIQGLRTTCAHDKCQEHGHSESTRDKLIPWVDPRTGKTHQINSRTGQTVNLRKIEAGPRSNSFFTTLQRQGRSQGPRTASAPSLWVENMLDSWDNPVFPRSEARVPSLNFESDQANITKGSDRCQDNIAILNKTHVARFKGKLGREALKMATTVAQVDRKFILAKLNPCKSTLPGHSDSRGVLVLIDQHAADERCRVEQLYEDMFISGDFVSRLDQVQTVEIDPIVLRVSASELALLRRCSKFWASWGITYSMATDGAPEGVIHIKTLPTLIAERCRLEPELLVDILRREIWLWETEERQAGMGRPANNSRPECNTFLGGGDTDSKHSWVQKLKGCPQGILDLLNSRACRGAIMFNDPLAINECEALVARLSRCAFPFQCAHGRPSMIPILDMRAQSGVEASLPVSDVIGSIDIEDDQRDTDFLDAFRRRYEK
ncbi:hypothetical protein PDE_06111 [Penicillium oxalicum 114-2]|uniref:MutL C-terminal dimerisation domain-containing protein n=1 Tax=Penicillium oxalicum (strain 114-2 / CGMCC 5302) TaxID=933388 RepID=S7ZR66_PENO1|nr:hypothetical protein PDE_06111 [Penicillium oxalicum 114-2]